MAEPALRMREIYRSIQGESTLAGWPCTFVRLAGCDIRCRWCDEPHALSGGDRVALSAVLARVAPLGCDLVCVTGGEPLVQRTTPELVRRLLDLGATVQVETGGHHDISVLDPRARVILDVKAPGSGEAGSSDPANLARLSEGDEVKLVLADRADYDWARALLAAHPELARVPVHLSPVHGALDPRDLVKWIADDRLPVRLNLQLHKYIWGPNAEGV